MTAANITAGISGTTRDLNQKSFICPTWLMVSPEKKKLVHNWLILKQNVMAA
jgi:hypothetical protein